jgi:hypothetical protein
MKRRKDGRKEGRNGEKEEEGIHTRANVLVPE